MNLAAAIRLFCYAATVIQASLLIGCASYAPAEEANLTRADLLKGNEALVTSGLYKFHLVVIKDSQLAQRYVGIDPVGSSMTPVFMKIANLGNDPIKIDFSASSLVSDTGESFRHLPIDEAIEIARRGDAEVVGWTIAFGLIGALASGSNTASTNKSLEEDYHNKSFKPTLINTKSSGEGLVFFYVPAAKLERVNTALIHLMNVTSQEQINVVIKF